ncbi:MAG: hypothetical protein JXK95_13820 [Bacteroidales bacterium]|nr:hypothetical protein [Bacteroidales bacterium]
MKTPKILFQLSLVICIIFLVINCNRQKPLKTVTVPFKADCTGEYIYFGPDTLPEPKCTGSLSLWRAVVDAKGTGEPMGNFTVHFDFCGDSLSNYGNLYAHIIDEKRDTLFLNSSGRVLDGRLDEHPAFVTSYWRDTIRFAGGTGRYKGATGIAVTDDYNSSEDPNSHHHWTGTIALVKGRK